MVENMTASLSNNKKICADVARFSALWASWKLYLSSTHQTRLVRSGRRGRTNDRMRGRFKMAPIAPVGEAGDHALIRNPVIFPWDHGVIWLITGPIVYYVL